MTIASIAVSCNKTMSQIAIRAYEKAGFRHVKTVQVAKDPEPGYLMRIAKENGVLEI